MTQQTSNLIKLSACYIIWGTAALYWNLFSEFGLVFKVACRVLFSFIFCIICLAASGKLSSIIETLTDKARIKYLVLYSISIGANWLIYVWSLSNGHVIDASLGNYMSPIAISVLSIFIFREKADVFQILSLSIALLGLVISILAYGSFPCAGIIAMATFTAYTLFKKKAGVQGLTASAIETGLLCPFALAYILIFGRGECGFGAINSIWDLLLLFSTGIYTAVPFVLYASGVNSFSSLFIGLTGMFTPTITLITGVLFLGEKLNRASLINFLCILIALVFFIISLIRKDILLKKPLKAAQKAKDMPM